MINFEESQLDIVLAGLRSYLTSEELLTEVSYFRISSIKGTCLVRAPINELIKRGYELLYWLNTPLYIHKKCEKIKDMELDYHFLKALKNDNIAEAKESVKLLTNLKDVEFKDGSTVHAGIPLKVFTKSPSFVSVTTLDEKLYIEIDTITPKQVDIKPLSNEDMIKIIDVAESEITNNGKVVEELSKSMKTLLPKWADSSAMAEASAKYGSDLGVLTNISRIHRYIGYFLDGSRNISYDFYEINKFTNKLVEASFDKKN